VRISNVTRIGRALWHGGVEAMARMPEQFNPSTQRGSTLSRCVCFTHARRQRNRRIGFTSASRCF